MLSEAFRVIVDHAADAIAVVDGTGEVVYANPAAILLLGARVATLRGGSVLELVHPEDRADLTAALQDALRAPGARPPRELRIAGKDRRWLPVEARAVNLLADPSVRGVVLTVRPVPERAHLTRALRTLGEANLVLVSAPDEDTLLQHMCETITGTGDYLLAWVGMKQHDADKTVLPVASSGAVGYLDEIHVSWGDNPRGQGPTGRSCRTGLIHVVDDFRSDSAYLPWRETATRFGFRTSCVLPLRSHGEVLGALNIYAAEPGAFVPEAVALLEKLASAVSYGIERLRDGNRLTRSLDATLGALAALTEKRDPYTAGHMCRVGLLAEAIADRLGMTQEEARGIRIAGDLHDIGKVVVPSEILTRPTRLSPEELALVRTHSRAGHDVISGIDFPWPVATMVVQHHERLDGSGYPNGLVGEQIIMGSRVLAVADTVEAMTNHRPYRPALGLEQALATVRDGAGSLYDPDVVAACVDMFSSGFSFEPRADEDWTVPAPRPEITPGAPGGA